MPWRPIPGMLAGLHLPAILDDRQPLHAEYTLPVPPRPPGGFRPGCYLNPLHKARPAKNTKVGLAAYSGSTVVHLISDDDGRAGDEAAMTAALKGAGPRAKAMCSSFKGR